MTRFNLHSAHRLWAWSIPRAVIALFLSSCAHTPSDGPPEKAPLVMCGVGSLRIVGQVSDATTGEPVEGAWIYYTPLGTTYPGADEDKPAMRESRGEPVGRSDATGRIDLSYEYGFSLEVPIDKAAADATDEEEAELRDRVVQSVSENSESIYCIDVSRAGYRSWVTVVESNDPRYVDGALRLGTIELVSIGGTQ